MIHAVAENATRRVVFRVVTVIILVPFAYALPQCLVGLTDKKQFNHNKEKLEKTF